MLQHVPQCERIERSTSKVRLLKRRAVHFAATAKRLFGMACEYLRRLYSCHSPSCLCSHSEERTRSASHVNQSPAGDMPPHHLQMTLCSLQPPRRLLLVQGRIHLSIKRVKLFIRGPKLGKDKSARPATKDLPVSHICPRRPQRVRSKGPTLRINVDLDLSTRTQRALLPHRINFRHSLSTADRNSPATLPSPKTRWTLSQVANSPCLRATAHYTNQDTKLNLSRRRNGSAVRESSSLNVNSTSYPSSYKASPACSPRTSASAPRKPAAHDG